MHTLLVFSHHCPSSFQVTSLYTARRNHSNVFRLVLRYYGNATHELLRNSTATLLWKRYGVHGPCYQGKSNMSQYLRKRDWTQRDLEKCSVTNFSLSGDEPFGSNRDIMLILLFSGWYHTRRPISCD
jgi:hypothetical protein